MKISKIIKKSIVITLKVLFGILTAFNSFIATWCLCWWIKTKKNKRKEVE